jgi:hypothetical protein
LIPLFHVEDGPYDYLVVYATDRRFRAHLQSPHVALLVLGILRRWAATTPTETPATGGIPGVLERLSERLGSLFERRGSDAGRRDAQQRTAPGSGVRRAITRALVKDYHHYHGRRTQRPRVDLLPASDDGGGTARSPGFPPSPSW